MSGNNFIYGIPDWHSYAPTSWAYGAPLWDKSAATVIDVSLDTEFTISSEIDVAAVTEASSDKIFDIVSSVIGEVLVETSIVNTFSVVSDVSITVTDTIDITHDTTFGIQSQVSCGVILDISSIAAFTIASSTDIAVDVGTNIVDLFSIVSDISVDLEELITLDNIFNISSSVSANVDVDCTIATQFDLTSAVVVGIEVEVLCDTQFDTTGQIGVTIIDGVYVEGIRYLKQAVVQREMKVVDFQRNLCLIDETGGQIRGTKMNKFIIGTAIEQPVVFTKNNTPENMGGYEDIKFKLVDSARKKVLVEGSMTVEDKNLGKFVVEITEAQSAELQEGTYIIDGYATSSINGKEFSYINTAKIQLLNGG